MNSFFHALNIGTLATWLSVVGFGTVGAILPDWRSMPPQIRPEKLEILTVTPDMTIGDEGRDDIPSPSPPDALPTVPDTLPGPPALPEIASTAPLPEIPDLPAAPSISPAARPAAKPATGRPAASGTSGKPSRSSSSSGSGLSSTNRQAAGHIPTPAYPLYSRRNRQEGKVVVKYSVNPAGRVTAAAVKTPCPWPLLNQTAVSAVMRGSFPPGGNRTLEITLIFKLK